MQREIEAALERTRGIVRTTPLLESRALNQRVGRRILVKAECLQVTGSFKFRGAWNALGALPPAQRSNGVIAYSSGNHAQGVAEAAGRMEVPAVIIMPSDAPRAKLDGTRELGADIITYDRPGGESREAIGEALARERDLTLIKPYDDLTVIAGQATCGVEIAQQAQLAGVSNCDVLTCCGGGGLTAGVALALSAHAPTLRVRPVEPHGADDTCRSLQQGTRLTIEGTPDTLCDAIVTPMPGELTFPILQRLCGPGLSVSDAEVFEAMALAMRYFNLVVEPGGAVALAAALTGRDTPTPGSDVIVIASGGNVDMDVFATALAAA